MTEVVKLAKGEVFQNIWKNFASQKTDPVKIEVRTHVRKSNQNGTWKDVEYTLPYYKWSACWRDLISQYPDATFEFEMFEKDKTRMKITNNLTIFSINLICLQSEFSIINLT